MSDNNFEPANTQPVEGSGEIAVPTIKKPRKWVTAAFNMASGAAVSLAMKTTVLACTASFLAPAVSIGVAAVAAGVASSYARHYLENRALVKSGQEPVKFTFKKAAFGGVFGLLGAGLAAAGTEALTRFAPDFVTEMKNFLGFSTPVCPPEAAVAPAPVVEPALAPSVTPEVEAVATPVPAPVDVPAAVELPATVIEADCPPCVAVPKAIDCVTDLAKADGVSDRVKDAIERAASTNARVSAQGVKDLGYFLFNGFDGMPKDPCLAVQLLKEAAENGNVQAKVDLAYLEYHGNAAAGITADRDAALEKMKALGSEKARWFVAQWTGVGTDAAPAPAAAPVSAPVVPAPAVSAPVAVTPLQTVTLPASTPVVSVDVTGDAPVQAAPVGATIESGPGMDCQPIIHSGSGNIDFVCSLPENDNNFTVGEKVIIQRPALLHLIR